MVHTKYFQHSIWKGFSPKAELDSAAVSIFVVILVELTNTETAVVTLSRAILNFQRPQIKEEWL